MMTNETPLVCIIQYAKCDNTNKLATWYQIFKKRAHPFDDFLHMNGSFMYKFR